MTACVASILSASTGRLVSVLRSDRMPSRNIEYVYFNLSRRIGWASQFLGEVRQIVTHAAGEIERLRARIRGFIDVSNLLAERAERTGSWAAWDPAVALGLAGRLNSRPDVRSCDRHRRRPRWVAAGQKDAARLRNLVLHEPEHFRAEINRYLARYRLALRLPDLSAPL